MANVQTVNLLVSRIRQRSDQINSTTFDDLTELKPWIRSSLAQLYEMTAQSSQDYYTTCRPLSLTAGQEAYSLPSDFKSLQNIYALYNGGVSRMQLREFAVDDLGALNNPYILPAPLSYRIMRNMIFLAPVPGADAFNALEIYYTPQYRAPLLDYTTIDEVLPDGFDEWVVLDVLQKMSVKTRLQNMDDILKSKQMMEARFTSGIANRGAYAPVMRDGTRRRSLSPGTSGGPLYWCIP